MSDLEIIDPVVADEHSLNRALSAFDLTLIGVGSVIGAGIFVMAGTAAAEHAGPAVMISFLIAALGCFLAGLCYAEFASMIPHAGSSYTYTYATMGRFMGLVHRLEHGAGVWRCRIRRGGGLVGLSH